MYIPGLTERKYENLPEQSYEGVFRGETVLLVGFLSKLHPIPEGQVSREHISVLRKLLRDPILMSWGYHYCDLCGPVGRILRSRRSRAGNGEIRVQAKNGDIFQAPVLILHYIEKHNYLPPESFLNALADGEIFEPID